MTLESEIQAHILTYLSFKQIAHRRINTQARIVGSQKRFAKSLSRGFPDVVCCINGRLIMIEVKAKKGKLSPDQLQTLNEYMEAGALCIVPKSLDFVIKILAQNPTEKKLYIE